MTFQVSPMSSTETSNNPFLTGNSQFHPQEQPGRRSYQDDKNDIHIPIMDEKKSMDYVSDSIPPPSYDSAVASSSSRRADQRTPSPRLSAESDEALASSRSPDGTSLGQLLSWIPSRSSNSAATFPDIVLPVIIPQIEVPPTGEHVPFARCYSDVLASRGVSSKEFVAFLDGLALAQALQPAAQGLKTFGKGVSKVPLPIIPLAGHGLAALASVGSGHSSSRSRSYLQQAQQDFFEPRGLRVQSVSDDELHNRLGLSTQIPHLAPLTPATHSTSLCDRRFEALSAYVAPLRYDVPAPSDRLQSVQKSTYRQIKSSVHRHNKHLDSLREKQWHDVRSSTPITAGNDWSQGYIAAMGEIRQTQVAMAELARQASRTGQDSGTRDQMLKLRGRLSDQQMQLQLVIAERHRTVAASRSFLSAEREELSMCRRLKWLVIENA